ncbi:RICIN domain-containing protein [Streptomyces sp. NBC_00257]|uniref:glycosyl hydrolase family 95 catalytic domain-containing protein n=1 Tax=unclassified Streptomyces TaxID=2593676 RepID=UPI00224DE2B3|nr:MULTISPECIES: RICIN domain-containing protein [unclassified Streptomyces]WTB58497.1 RICIN domain-containing protein [Streptomyces sp. NBC_00826]WTH88623.1 RICIN domain-containing protein [Streptomyces sp. NBC_00825]WTH97353.1 RICIN domain-containing protein [Streptomyces sp. NBC_00822]MCX4862863.1 RICIN domain-containing protein [Streptomyces sp. NBC_00906]MCX4894100.1 RICIN domain-containing protein [Streptomyces sp. NBC_00892]
MPPPETSLNRRSFITTTALTAGAVVLPGGILSTTATAAAPPRITLPQRGMHDTAPASTWTDGFVTGNGEYGAVLHGTPELEKVVLNHHRFVLPNGTRDVKPPLLSDRLNSVRDKALAGDHWGAAGSFAEGWSLRWTQTFHPGYELQLSTPSATTADDYARTTDFRTGEVTHAWADSAGTWQRHAFVSRADEAVVHELLPADGRTVDTTIKVNTALEGVPDDVAFTTTATVVNGEGFLGLRATYPSGQGAFGYEGVTRVVVTGTKASVAAVGGTLVVSRAAKVVLLTKLGRYEKAGDWDTRPLHTALAALSADYAALLGRHAPLHRAMFDGSSLDLGVSSADRLLSTSELTERQNNNRSTVDIALLERMYDSGRYLFVSSSGVLPPRLTGIWAGSWNGAWADDFTTDANINLQVAGGNILSHGNAMQGYFDLVLGQLDDWRRNAANLYGARGFLAPSRTDGEHGHMLHFNGGDFPGQCWTGGADWMLYPLLEHYQVTGDNAFLRDRLGPALMELALFYEDFLTRTDSDGRVVFVPSFSMENSPSNTGQMLSVNATGDIMAGRHALRAAIDAANILGVEQGGGQGVARWTALLAKLPDYGVNGDGALAEWSWPGLDDRYNHRHAQHLYGAWPLHEINPEEEPALVSSARRALRIRGDENYSAHGSLHRALAWSRLKDGAGVYDNIRKILGNNMVWRSLVTSHNPELHVYNCDAANALPAVIAESLVCTRPGFLEILPALPEQLARGTIRGVRGRNRVLVESLTWDTSARTAAVTLVSDIAQTLTFVCRRGITSLATTAPSASSPLGDHARRLTLTAGTRTQVTVGMLTGTFRVVNRASGRVLDVADESTGNGASVIQWPWSGRSNQQWRLLPNHDGSFRLSNVNSGKVLDNPGTSSAPGHALDQWTDTDSPNQWWKLEPSGTNGHCHLTNGASGLRAGVENGSTDDGARILQVPADGSPSQEWAIVAL